MPKQRQSPSEKKQIAYKKDRVLVAEYPKSLRKQLPKKKARVNRKERRQVRQLLDDATPSGNVEARVDMPLRPVKRDVSKWGCSTVSLGERVAAQYARRVSSTAWNFFKKPYDSELHKARFIAFLTEITKSKTLHTRAVLNVIYERLQSDRLKNHLGWYVYNKDFPWLQAFIADAPEWETRLKEWIESDIE